MPPCLQFLQQERFRHGRRADTRLRRSGRISLGEPAGCAVDQHFHVGRRRAECQRRELALEHQRDHLRRRPRNYGEALTRGAMRGPGRGDRVGAGNEGQRRRPLDEADAVERDDGVGRRHRDLHLADRCFPDFVEQRQRARADLRGQRQPGLQQEHRAKIGSRAFDVAKVQTRTAAKLVAGGQQLPLARIGDATRANPRDHRHPEDHAPTRSWWLRMPDGPLPAWDPEERAPAVRGAPRSRRRSRLPRRPDGGCAAGGEPSRSSVHLHRVGATVKDEQPPGRIERHRFRAAERSRALLRHGERRDEPGPQL